MSRRQSRERHRPRTCIWLSVAIVAVFSLYMALAGVSTASARSDSANSAVPQSSVVGPQSDHSLPRTDAIKSEPSLGPTQEVPTGAYPQAGAVAGVNLRPLENYCSHQTVLVSAVSSLSVNKGAEAVLFANEAFRHFYFTVPAGGVGQAYFNGVSGAYRLWQYVWSGSSGRYVFDEYRTSTNTCSVVRTVTNGPNCTVKLAMTNTGTAYATVASEELAPYRSPGEYRDYPIIGGSSLVRTFSVGCGVPYAIVARVLGIGDDLQNLSSFTGVGS